MQTNKKEFIMKHVFFLILLTLSHSIFSMDYKEAELVVWKTGKSLFGNEFISSSEDVVDYLSGLERPENIFKTYKYKCMVKSQTITSIARTISGETKDAAYVYITTVYGIKDCERL